MTAEDLRKLTHEELIARAASRGVRSPRAMTEAELIEAILGAGKSRPKSEPPPPSRVRSWFGVARDLVARVVDRGLHLPEAAQLLRGMPRPVAPRPPPPLPTVTLAEIYAAQGYTAKALAVLDEVLTAKPDHREAAALRDRLTGRPSTPAQPPARVQASVEAPVEVPAEVPVAVPVAVPLEEAPVEDARAEADPPADLPDHYGTDELVALPTDPHTAYAYWELRPLRFARARQRDPEGRLVLRLLSVRPHGATTEIVSRDAMVDELVGDRFVHDLPAGSELRLCLGWAGPNGFIPLVVGTEIKMPHDNGVASVEAPAGATGLDALGARANGRALRAYLVHFGSRPAGSFGEMLAAYEQGTLSAEDAQYVAPLGGGSPGSPGASELSHPGASRGGASELTRGGSSELLRRNPALSRG